MIYLAKYSRYRRFIKSLVRAYSEALKITRNSPMSPSYYLLLDLSDVIVCNTSLSTSDFNAALSRTKY